MPRIMIRIKKTRRWRPKIDCGLLKIQKCIHKQSQSGLQSSKDVPILLTPLMTPSQALQTLQHECVATQIRQER